MRDKLIQSRTVCPDVDLTSSPRSPAACLCQCDDCLQKLYQSAVQRAIQRPQRCNKRTIYSNKGTSVLEAMLDGNVNKKPAMTWQQAAMQNHNLGSNKNSVRQKMIKFNAIHATLLLVRWLRDYGFLINHEEANKAFGTPRNKENDFNLKINKNTRNLLKVIKIAV